MLRDYGRRIAGELRAWGRWGREFPSDTRPLTAPARADLALVQCPIWSVDWPSLSLGFLSASAEAHGIRPAIFDVNAGLFARAPQGLREYWHWSKIKYWEDARFIELVFSRFRPEIDSFRDAVLATQCRLIGFSVFGTSLLFTIRFAQELKARAPSIPIVFGGHEIDKPSGRKLVPPSCCDAFALGEAEGTLIDMYRSITETGALSRTIPGIIVKDSSPIPRPPLRDLDAIPWPTWTDFDLGMYTSRSLPLLFSRGCLSRCSFCTDTAHFKRFRHRSPDNMMREIRSHTERYGIHTFRFHDLLINGNVDALDRLCDGFVSSGVELHWTAMAMARKEMTEKLYRKLRAAGCAELDVGVESGSNKVLARMKKFATAEEISRNIQLAAGAGIKMNISLVIGHPGEEEEDLRQTVEFLTLNAPAIHRINNINHCVVTYGSDIWNHPERYGIILPEPLDTAYINWRSADGGNTLEMRMERQRRVLSVCASLGIPVAFANLYDGAVLDMQEAKRALSAPVCPVP
jgi:radical SAM superfamily enzyme YgiQ (UPF0313 family)